MKKIYSKKLHIKCQAMQGTEYQNHFQKIINM